MAHNGGMGQTTRYLLISVVCVLAILAWILGVTRVFGQEPTKPPVVKPRAAEVADAPKPQPPTAITDLEARKIRELQLVIAESQTRLLRMERQFKACEQVILLELERQFKTEQTSLQTATKELDSYLDSLQVKYAAKDYDLDQQLAWQKKKK